MPKVQVFDPAMCCPTGVCGPAVDPHLVRFAADLEWLKAQGVSVERFNLSQQAVAFAEDAEVKAALRTQGESALPLIKVDGEVRSTGKYPSRDQLAAWAGLDAPPASIYTEAVQELVSIGAAIASNCEPCSCITRLLSDFTVPLLPFPRLRGSSYDNHSLALGSDTQPSQSLHSRRIK